MEIIHDLRRLTSLPIKESIRVPLLQHLTEPFGSVFNAIECWEEIGCFLVYIDHCDGDRALNVFDQAHNYCLTAIKNHHEYVVKIGENNSHLLVLAILHDSGSGVYLLAPIDHPSRYLKSITI
ncbi:hypothetical protein OA79_07590 [Marinomonas sp. TW1]|nr:hypothetical protein OA79_07590 [Marinomonas sp. TW1]